VASASASAAALDVDPGLVDPAADVLEVSAVDAAPVVVFVLAPDVDAAPVVDAEPPVCAATTGDVRGLSAWVLTIGRWPGR
jgi:hypothetical protein